MKNIEIDEDIYQFIASKTEFIGESASSILRRLLSMPAAEQAPQESTEPVAVVAEDKSAEKAAENVTVVSDIEDEQALTGSVFHHINKEELAMQRGAVGRFLLILAALYRVHKKQFDVVSEIRGRDRLYFATDKQELAESGSSTKPFQIPDSPYWVITNSNTTRKKMILTKAALALGYTDDEAESIRELL